MNVYIYQADIYCESCGGAIRAKLACSALADPDNESSYDSDEFPKGPYSDGGGEADCPQHCAACGLFLENPLTRDGYAYVQEVVNDGARDGRGLVWMEWAAFYDVEPEKE